MINRTHGNEMTYESYLYYTFPNFVTDGVLAFITKFLCTFKGICLTFDPTLKLNHISVSEQATKYQPF